jgi:predicted signal transduction protein with EAL and GGDEF domain
LTLEAAEGALIADFGEATTRLEKVHDMGCDKDWLTKNTRDLRTRGPK